MSITVLGTGHLYDLVSIVSTVILDMSGKYMCVLELVLLKSKDFGPVWKTVLDCWLEQ